MSGHQRITAALQGLDAQEKRVRDLAQRVRVATGEDARAVSARWHTHGTTAAQQEVRVDPAVRGALSRVFDKMHAIAQAEWETITRERNRPSAADYQEQYHRTHGRWPTLREQEDAGY